ncbi:MAG: DUF3575 domain-containing protein [Bacteroidales bacterium]|nr:DUF3575 domain-containing protein [Bacteroidales bacterium]
MNRKALILMGLFLLMAAPVKAQQFSVSTNILDYVNLGTLNLDASYGLDVHWSVGAAVKYNPYTNRQRSGALTARFWPWHVFSGWWVAGAMRYQEYNTGGYKTFRKKEDEPTNEGDRLGGGLSGGYSYMLGKHFNLDIGAGFWMGYDLFKIYSCPTCGSVVGSGRKFFILPSDLTLGISYVF